MKNFLKENLTVLKYFIIDILSSFRNLNILMLWFSTKMLFPNYRGEESSV